MDLKLKDRDAPINLEVGPDGRLYATFTAEQDMDSISLLSDCLGDIEFKNIQFEIGGEATSFAEPVVYSNPRSGVFAIIDTVTDEFKQLLTDVQKGVKSEISQSADAINLSVKELFDQTVKSSSVTINSDGVVIAAGKSTKDFAKAVGGYFSVTPEAISLFSDLIKVKGDMIVDGSITTAKLKTGSVTADIISSDAITGKHLKVDNAFMDKITANDVLVNKITSKEAFLTQLNAVQITADNIKNRLLQSLNGATAFDLNTGTIEFYTDTPALRRVIKGFPNQFIRFATGNSDQIRTGVTVIGSNRYGTESSNDGGFVGIRAWNGPDTDAIDLVGDSVRLTSSPYENADGWLINTLPNQLKIDARRNADRPSSRMNVGDVHIYSTASTYSSLKETINLLIDNIQILHDNKTTEYNYNYTIPSKI